MLVEETCLNLQLHYHLMHLQGCTACRYSQHKLESPMPNQDCCCLWLGSSDNTQEIVCPKLDKHFVIHCCLTNEVTIMTWMFADDTRRLQSFGINHNEMTVFSLAVFQTIGENGVSSIAQRVKMFQNGWIFILSEWSEMRTFSLVAAFLKAILLAWKWNSLNKWILPTVVVVDGGSNKRVRTFYLQQQKINFSVKVGTFAGLSSTAAPVVETFLVALGQNFYLPKWTSLLENHKMWLFNPILIFQGHTKLLRLQMKATAFACFGLDQRNMKGFLSLPSDIVYII